MRGMLAEMTATEYAEWMAFYSLEPWGCEKEDLRTGILASTIANMSGRAMKAGHVAKPADFMPGEAEKPKSVVDRIKAAFGYGGKR